ncbi:LOW QUALITY PROTEIN: homocysteine-responsive endoplasmic reticulum-resident ubiquitin-like domain member 2 protein [Phascolarctos cinereus]|uniref:Homocysteine-responsive endoplasmic reticulum-resident ubiquitin-like domain member 2 protein n=1 Tax=Phascolarctos cinereus TaxID=38626 RepID=A0A6P5ICY3_PHACI|nr:LOW QUALITY PROTEIN: homocysteine-responsive endoplasmic reticulum-resident ubiquitin-like domain member 2 protein [Phascolarctos cinereus]
MEGPSGSEPRPVTLVIKTPNQRYSDQTIRCPAEWTVGRLKAHLADAYPGKPSPKDQRLVYSGRLLPDHLQLKDIVRKQDEYHMVHLVCASRTPPSSPQPSSRRGSEEALTSISSYSSDNSGSSTPSSSQESLAPTVSSGSEGLRFRSSPQAPADPEQSLQFPYVMQGNIGDQFPGQALPAGFPVYPAFSPLQMLWWQQMYARQYYMQYQAAVSAQATSNTDPARPAAAQAPGLANVPAQDPLPGPNARAPDNRALNPNVQMNAQGGPVVNEEDLNRDWLDWMYTFSRAAILLSIVYFYSSFSRFIMVMGAMLLVYLHQAGWLPFRQEGGQLQVPNNADVNHDGQNGNNPDLEEMERLMDDGLGDESEEDAGEDAGAGPQPGLMASAWSFVTTFFTSLIPEGPPQVAN